MSECANRVAEIQNEGAYAVLAAAQALEREGHDIVHLEIGQPGFPSPAHVLEAGAESLRRGQTKYSDPAGLPALRKSIAQHVSRTRGLHVTPEEIVVGPGAKPGLFFTSLALVNPGDEVMYPDPGFPTYKAMIQVAGGIPVPIPLRPDGSSFDMVAFHDKISAKTKMVVLNSPSNPTGGVMPIDDLKKIALAAVANDAFVLSDEIYSGLVYGESKMASIFNVPNMRDRTILIDGFSKTYCMTGWRLGWAVMPAHLARRVELLLVHSIGCTATFTQLAGISALEGPQDGVDFMRREYQRRRDYVVDALNAIDGVTCPRPSGAFYVFPDVSRFGMSSKELASLLLTEAGVAVLPGTDFGERGEGHIRLSYAGDMESLVSGLEKISHTLQKLPVVVDTP